MDSCPGGIWESQVLESQNKVLDTRLVRKWLSGSSSFLSIIMTCVQIPNILIILGQHGGQPLIPVIGKWRQKIPRANWLAIHAELVSSRFSWETSPQYRRWTAVEHLILISSLYGYPTCLRYTCTHSQTPHAHTHGEKKKNWTPNRTHDSSCGGCL